MKFIAKINPPPPVIKEAKPSFLRLFYFEKNPSFMCMLAPDMRNVIFFGSQSQHYITYADWEFAQSSYGPEWRYLEKGGSLTMEVDNEY